MRFLLDPELLLVTVRTTQLIGIALPKTSEVGSMQEIFSPTHAMTAVEVE